MSKERLHELAQSQLVARGLDTDPYRKRLDKELLQIEIQGQEDYFLQMYDQGVKFPFNEHNLLTAFLLGLAPDFDPDEETAFTQEDYPDIDTDCQPFLRDYIKNIWAPKTFGADKVCAIANYTTFGIKSSLIDMARVYSKDRDEILSLTTKLGLKDDEGQKLTWDKALEMYPDLRKYCEVNPEVADSARQLLERSRSLGQHAGGLIISSIPISDIVPLVRGKDGQPCSSWTEGLASSDLGPVGLIKFDFLVVTDLLRILVCSKMVKRRHGLTSICALPDLPDWSDEAYLNDPESLKLANAGRLKGIFQFDSGGIRHLVKAGGVDSFEDLVAYVSLYRPGPMAMGMHDRYVERKRGREEWESKLHPLLKPIMGKTYGVLVYQEQILKILNLIGGIPEAQTEKIRKAISKKKVEQFAKDKDIFFKNAAERLGWPVSREGDNQEFTVQWLYDQVEAFSGYGFNRSLTIDTTIYTPDGPKKIQDFRCGDRVYCIDETGCTTETEVLACYDHGQLDGYEVVFDDGYSVVCSLDHKFLTADGQKPLWMILKDSVSVLCDPSTNGGIYAKEEGRLENEMWGDGANQCGNVGSSKGLSKMQGDANSAEVDQIEKHHKMRHQSSELRRSSGSSSQLPEMPGFGVEDAGRNGIQGKVRQSVQGSAIVGCTSEAMSRMRTAQEAKCSRADEEVKRGQFAAREKGHIFSNRQENISTTGDSTSTGGSTEAVERCQPRAICQKPRSGITQSEAVKNGNLAAGTAGLEEIICALRKRQEGSGSGQRENMDRSRWMLSLLSDNQKELVSTTQPTESAETRRYAESRGYPAQESYAHQGGYEMFSATWRDEARMVGAISEHAQITNTRRLVSRRIIRVVPVGKRQMYDIEVACSTHNFLLPTGIVTSNSHAVAYTLLTMRLLWFKVHYPLEFFSATLQCEHVDDKLREYMLDARRHNIAIQPLDLNKSKENFTIMDGDIYSGFAKVKGIGQDIAKKIVCEPYTELTEITDKFEQFINPMEPEAADISARQPYSSLEDFCYRFGTHSNVLKPLIALRVFGNNAREIYNYYEHYKEDIKRRKNRDKTNAEARSKHIMAMAELLGVDEDAALKFLEDFRLANYSKRKEFKMIVEATTQEAHDFAESVWVLGKKYQKCVDSYNEKIEFDARVKVERIKEAEITPELAAIFESRERAEMEYYGFTWKHPLQTIEDYDPDLCFAQFEENQFLLAAPVQVMVVSQPRKKVSKNGKTTYYTFSIEDCNYRRERINIWSDEWARFEPEFSKWDESTKRGEFLQLKLRRPTEGFNTYNLDSPSRREKWKIPKSKEEDYRVLILLEKEKKK